MFHSSRECFVALSLVFLANRVLGQSASNGSSSSGESGSPGHSKIVPFEGIRECPYGSDEDLNNCLRLLVKDAHTYFLNGLPEIGFESVEPIRQTQRRLRLGPLHVVLRNLEIHGVTKYKSGEVTVNTALKELYTKYHYPLLRLTTDYTLETTSRPLQLLLGALPSLGAGKFEMDLVNFKSNDTYTMQIVPDEDGLPILRVKNVVSDGRLETLHVNLPALANGGPIARLLNRVLNWSAIWIFQAALPIFNRINGEYLTENAKLPTLIPASHFAKNDIY